MWPPNVWEKVNSSLLRLSSDSIFCVHNKSKSFLVTENKDLGSESYQDQIHKYKMVGAELGIL